MLNPGKPGARTIVFAAALVALALLACKKSSSDATPTATVPTPPPAATPEAPKEPEPSASASAAPATDDTAVKTPTVVPTTKLDGGTLPKDAGVIKDAGTDAAHADAGKTPTSSAADAKAIEACCGSLAAEAKKPGPGANKYKSAAAVCGGISAQVKKGAADAASARTTIRAQLQGVPIPGGC